jgi:hypothetical protein
VQGSFRSADIRRAPRALAVDGHDLRAAEFFPHAFGPVDERLGKLPGVKCREHRAKSIVAGDAPGQLQKAAQPCFLLQAKAFHGRKLLLAAEHRAKGDDENVAQAVTPPVHGARIVQATQQLNQIDSGKGSFVHPTSLPAFASPASFWRVGPVAPRGQLTASRRAAIAAAARTT